MHKHMTLGPYVQYMLIYFSNIFLRPYRSGALVIVLSPTPIEIKTNTNN